MHYKQRNLQETSGFYSNSEKTTTIDFRWVAPGQVYNGMRYGDDHSTQPDVSLIIF